MVNPKYSLKSAILVSPRAFDDLRFVPSDNDNDKDKVSYTLISDVSLLLNSQRIIDTLGEDVYRHLVNSMMPKKSPYQDNKIPDNELFFVKPRNCQEHSELRAWSQVIMDHMSDLRESLKPVETSVPAPAPAPTPTQTE